MKLVKETRKLSDIVNLNSIFVKIKDLKLPYEVRMKFGLCSKSYTDHIDEFISQTRNIEKDIYEGVKKSDTVTKVDIKLLENKKQREEDKLLKVEYEAIFPRITTKELEEWEKYSEENGNKDNQFSASIEFIATMGDFITDLDTQMKE